MRRAALVVAAAALALPGTASAVISPMTMPGMAPVTIQFGAFAPAQVDVLPGETVMWTNGSPRQHTVNADDGSFASGVLASGNTFTRRFPTVGTYAYHCIIHLNMTGEIDVRRVTLQPLPSTAVGPGTKVELHGRTADPGVPVRIERADGASFTTVGTTTPAPDGTWGASISASQSAYYRAANDRGASQTRRLLVSGRKIRIRATRRGVSVRVTPALPDARVVLQQYLRERFGWWSVKSARLDFVSYARFRVHRPARVRVLLIGPDGSTPIAKSKVLTLKRRWR
ncbi:MAG: hypothetical protein QOG15_1539 [Solirubrobacteraceae bacterium]|jgi:plastocyanin|nr:hypothetical protein [Solirubrobacteraceae bacterium]